MKKSIIAASAASVALAAMPVMGTFAATETVVDNLNVTLQSTCQLTRVGNNGTGTNAGAWTSGTETYAVEMAAGQTSELGKSTFTVLCNDTSTAGHNLTVTVTGLTSTSNTAATGAPIAYDGSKTVGTDAGNYWNITTATGTGTLPSFSAGLVAMSNNETTKTLYSSTNPGVVVNNATFDATYKVSTTATQPSGQYAGTATYVLTHGA